MLAAGVLLASSGCSGSPSPDEKKGATTTASAAASAKTGKASSQTGGALNPLTGLTDMDSADSRPVAIMIGNNDKSRPQYGIDEADMLIEGETEGGITRIMAVFSDVSRVPDAVGPVRSARSPFVKLAVALDAVYCHCGGSPGGLSTLQASGLAEIDGTTYDGSTFWRDEGLKNSKGYEYSMLTSGAKLLSRIQNLNLRQKSENPAPFTFGGKTGGQTATKAQIYLSPAQTISFTYDEQEKLYYKCNGTLENGTPHKTASGNQLSAANVIVIYDDRETEQTSSFGAAIYNYYLSSGSGTLISGGTARDIQWSRSDSGLSFTEQDGSALSVAKGKTYLCFVYSGYKQNTVVR